MAEISWVKLSTDLFNNRKIRQIEALPDGDAIVVIWLHLLCLAGNINDKGLVYFTPDIPYTEQTLAVEFNRPLATVQMALKVFEQFGMIEIVNDFMLISNWEKYQNVNGMERVREQTRKRVANFRERQKLLTDECNVTVTLRNGTDIDKDIDKEKEEKILKEEKPKRFKKPTVEEIDAYLKANNISNVNAERFWNYYEATGWTIGKARKPMKSWQAAIRTWKTNGYDKPKKDFSASEMEVGEQDIDAMRKRMFGHDN